MSDYDFMPKIETQIVQEEKEKKLAAAHIELDKALKEREARLAAEQHT